MKLDKLLRDATGAADGDSARSQHIRLAEMLSADGEPVSHRRVEQWFARGSIPARWLMAIPRAAKRQGRNINITKYS